MFLFLFFLTAAVQPEKTIELFTNFEVNTEALSSLTQEKNAFVIPGNSKRFKKKKKLHKLLKKTIAEKAPAKVVFWNLKKNQCGYNFNAVPKEQLLLFMWEPPIVLPKMYEKKLHSCFGKIYTWDDTLVDGKKYFKFHYPVLKPMQGTHLPFEEKKLCTMVVGYHKNDHPGELYSKREEYIRFFEEKNAGDFAFFGRGWEKNFSTYGGPIEDKIEVLQHYRFSICIENMQKEGYITEKIFDCFAACNVPVYLGAPNIESYIPQNCFIDLRDFSSKESLYQFLKEMPKETYDQYVNNIKIFLKSKRAQQFSQTKFNQIFLDALDL